MQGILSSGFEIEQMHTQSVGSGDQSGLFIILQLKAPGKVASLDANLDIQDKFKLAESHSSPDIILDEDDDL